MSIRTTKMHSEQDLEEEKETKNILDVFNLAQIPTNQWKNLQVGRMSIFDDTIWDWRQQGSPLYEDCTFFNWDKEISDGVSLLDIENEPILKLLKAILFYSLPQNACLIRVRSFNTSVAIGKHLILLGKFLYQNNVYVDFQGNGSFRNAVNLSQQRFLDFIDNGLISPHAKYDFARQIKHWKELSMAKIIPSEYRLDIAVISEKLLRKLNNEMEKSKGTYLPISIDTLSFLVPLCVKTIESSEDILSVYDAVWPIIASKKIATDENFDWTTALTILENIKSDHWNMDNFIDHKHSMSSEVENQLQNTIMTHPDWLSHLQYTSNIWKLPNKKIIEIAKELKIDLYDFSKQVYYDVAKIRGYIMTLATKLRNACTVIIFLTTGMRRSEVHHLQCGNYWRQKGTKDEYRIRFLVFKTSDSSSGDIVTLPIPQITYKALKSIEQLTKNARLYGKTSRLMVCPTLHFGKEIVGNAINQFIERWCDDLGIEHIHPHQFRKTIAMYVIYQDPRNIDIIKRLFSHKSLAMTLAYIVKLPGMTEEFKLAILQHQKSLLTTLMQALDKDMIGGKAGNRIKTAYKAQLNDDSWEDFDQYLDIVLGGGQNILHRTQFAAICTNNHGSFIHLGPETCNCDVVDCNFAVFTEDSINALEDDITFHARILKRPYTDQDQQTFSIKHIQNCIQRLSELQGKDIIAHKYPEFIELGA